MPFRIHANPKERTHDENIISLTKYASLEATSADEREVYRC